jgi:subtilase family serine protease
LSCYNPLQLQRAYNLAPLYRQGYDGTGATIVIVDAFGSPSVASDLAVFDAEYGLPAPPSLDVFTPAGALPPFDPTDADMVGWSFETTLDVEWAHAMAPGARIVLLATPVSETEAITGFPEIVQAENWAIDHGIGDVISQSFGATEDTFASPRHDIAGLRSAFKNAARHNVTVLAASGDLGATDALIDGSCCYPYRVNSWPSSDPLVTSVGGTQLHLDADGNRLSVDVAWNDGFGAGGGGVSKVFDRPSFQDGVERVVGGSRGTPDISMSAAVDGGVLLYYGAFPEAQGWYFTGGTSVSAPLLSGIVAIAKQYGGRRLGNINQSLYSLAGRPNGGVVDVTIGDNSFAGVSGFAAGRGYDLASGVGTLDANRLVRSLSAANH